MHVADQLAYRRDVQQIGNTGNMVANSQVTSHSDSGKNVSSHTKVKGASALSWLDETMFDDILAATMTSVSASVSFLTIAHSNAPQVQIIRTRSANGQADLDAHSDSILEHLDKNPPRAPMAAVLRSVRHKAGPGSTSVYLLQVTICQTPEGVWSLSMLRTSDSAQFCDQEVTAVQGLASLAGAMIRGAQKNAGQSEKPIDVWPLLNTLTMGVMAVDRLGRVVTMNESARTIVGRNDGLAIRRGTLFFEEHHEEVCLRSLLQELAAQPIGGESQSRAVIVSRRNSESTYQLMLTRIDPPFKQGSGQKGQAELYGVFISDAEQSSRPSAHWLRDLYRLTPVEGKIATLTCQGLSVDQIAFELRMSVHTVRAYLKPIYQKMSVHRQANMVRLLVSGPGQVRIQLPDIKKAPTAEKKSQKQGSARNLRRSKRRDQDVSPD